MSENNTKDMLSPKVAAMYQAVLDLMMEEVDLSTLKVADITSKAGIGKGTAYEYFESKEDIIASAILYYMESWLKNIAATMEMQKSFMQAMEYLFDVFHKYSEGKEQNAFAKICFLTLMPGPTEIKRKLAEKMQGSSDEDCCKIHFEHWNGMYQMIKKAQEKGEIVSDIPISYISYAIAGKVMIYLTYYLKASEEMKKECSCDQMKTLLVEGIRKEFVC